MLVVFDLAGTVIDSTRVLLESHAASNPRGLFRLCACVARGAIASSRLSRLPSGTFAYELKRPLSDGRKTLVWTGKQLVRQRLRVGVRVLVEPQN